mmetsp:Transcript_5910/g.9163  ORF Transcript_5910/g.9163 Transcript_5910/m.9163 type:complete len:214 (-) Transcript_5910:70-711(-)|eukprot:CAMPEP_0174383612 /NCGR_PEP_ID=MMETSP0811_2-20130205/125358_1 /TAXON_ID=73025 ORGANISM="Eutreptiella gymnastica-like, Strain CCMP1594" /NCGR_SAMPLE_ID=MMETSP0811_2 /ASSEMBLY_ACC=CAM_ASM_000667 /LENGTH=213 /DNA_ID=CAMNT_0015537269 /DNA_START=112 /DNA_END=753 /DNA_ORIENTATION=-
MPVVIGLTGGIACGKSTVSQLLAERGATIVDADLIVRELQAVGSPVLQEMVDVFGPEILTETGELDRKGLGKIIFADPVARQKLNGILHPKVLAEMHQQVATTKAAGKAVIVVDVPLLFESCRDAKQTPKERYGVDTVVVVAVPPEVQLARLMDRDQSDEEQAQRRINSQMPLAEKLELANVVVDNKGTREETKLLVDALWNSWISADPTAEA